MKAGKWCKRAILAALSAGSSLVIAACYGAFYGMQPLASGRVTHNGQGVRGLQVCAEFQNNPSVCTTTEGNGYYNLEAEDPRIDEANTSGFTIVVTDIDGEDNGGLFQETEVDVTAGDVPAEVDVQVEIDPTAP